MSAIVRKISDKTFTYVLLILLIGLFFSIPLLSNNFYVTHDGQAQVVRIAAYYQAIIDGQIPPRWAGNLNYQHGLPTLSFFFPLEGYLGTVFHLIGFSFQDSYKILMIGSFLFSPVFFFFFLNKLFKKEVAFVGAILYGLAPYHFLDVYVRGQLAEMLALMFAPLLFLIIEKNLKKPKLKFVFFGGVIHTLLILSHSVLSLIFTGIAFFYIVVITWPKKKLMLQNLAIIASGLLFATFFWLPALYEGRYINSKLFVGDFYKDHFASLKNLFYSPWGFGSDVNKIGGLSPQIGPFLFGLGLLSLIFLSKIKKKKRFLFFLIIFFLSIFMSLSLSEIIWSKFHLIQQFQFPWRFTAISSFSAAILSTFFLSKVNKKLIFIVIAVVLLFSVQYARFDKTIDRKDSFYLTYPGTGAYHGEATTIWTAGDAKAFPKFPIEVISGKGKVNLIQKKIGFHKFKTVSETKLKILDNTVYFPGWIVKVDGDKVPVEFQDMNHRGLITFDVPKGNHMVEVIFKETKLRLFADVVSLFTFGFVLLYFLLKRIIKK